MYGTIRMHQERDYPGRVSGTDLHNPDFAALGKAYGAHGELVETTAEFAPAFERALASRQAGADRDSASIRRRSPRARPRSQIRAKPPSRRSKSCHRRPPFDRALGQGASAALQRPGHVRRRLAQGRRLGRRRHGQAQFARRHGFKLLSQTRDTDGKVAWLAVQQGALMSEEETGIYIERQVKRDPDLWVVEIEDKKGRNPFEGKLV